ncbi:hypothetical protein Tco_0129428 [Tanacetum coccineum]
MVKSTHILAWQHEVVFAAMVGRIPFVNDLLMLPCICFAATMGQIPFVNDLASRHRVCSRCGSCGVVQCFVDALFNVVSLSEGVPLINVIFFWIPFVDALLMLPCILLTLPIPGISFADDVKCMTRSSTKKLFTPSKNSEREFRSSRRLFKTLSLDELNSPEFNLFYDLEEHSEEEVAEIMVKTMEEYMCKT